MALVQSCGKHYDILVAAEAAQLVDVVNKFLADHPDWRLHGPTFFANGGYRQAVRRRKRDRSWLLPHKPQPMCEHAPCR